MKLPTAVSAHRSIKVIPIYPDWQQFSRVPGGDIPHHLPWSFQLEPKIEAGAFYMASRSSTTKPESFPQELAILTWVWYVLEQNQAFFSPIVPCCILDLKDMYLDMYLHYGSTDCSMTTSDMEMHPPCASVQHPLKCTEDHWKDMGQLMPQNCSTRTQHNKWRSSRSG